MNAKVDPARLEAIRELPSASIVRRIAECQRDIFRTKEEADAARAERDAAWANEQITRDQRDWAIVAAMVFALLWAGPWLLSWFE
jgi:hypothetical protein